MKVDKPFLEAMRHATQLVRTGGPAAATRFIQGLFRPNRAAPQSSGSDVSAADSADTIVEVLDPLPAQELRVTPLPETLPSESGRFLNQRYSGPDGSRNYKLYVPSAYTGSPLPLVVMLHGCTQGPDDFATGTRANRWAESQRCLVVYPEQIQRANSHRCWNWFRPVDQQAGRGEPAIIAGIVKQVIDEYQIDKQRVYVAGLSAGGAMAAIMAQEYPALFAAAGVHSGLPVGAAHDVGSALTVMKTGQPTRALRAATAALNQRAVPMIVLHGDADHTVNPANAARLIQSAVEIRQLIKPNSPLQTSVQTVDASDGSRAYRRTRHATAAGVSVIEQWEIHGGGHAWSGGNAGGSYADGRGPDATRAMLQFFYQHAMPEEAIEDVTASPVPM
ncbi:MAG: PHB depolymerase family esterase [Pseudomonadota bacterium]|nr:PHB depolymerase family esterase [Burkholderiaceae bacterium]MDQ3447296.1 PHB depolymerase family esterase [Pseudomonadota bacterium]